MSNEEYIENLIKEFEFSKDQATAIVMMQLYKLTNTDVTELLPHIKSPTLLIWGRNDTATPVSDAELMEKTMKDAGLVVLENCGHYSFLEQQYTFNRVMSSFMKL